MFSFEGEDVFVTCSGGIAHSVTDRLIDQVAIAEDLVASAKAAGRISFLAKMSKQMTITMWLNRVY